LGSNARGIAVDVWFDLVCPWCLLGKRRFEAALERFEHREAVRVRWRSLELDPGSPGRGELTIPQRMRRDLGVTPEKARQMLVSLTESAAAMSLDYRLTEARPSNSFDAHRLMHYAEEQGLGGKVRERLSIAYTAESAIVSEHEVLAGLARECGLDGAGVTALLKGDDYAEAVRRDRALASQIGVSGVPSFVFEGKYVISGAQSVEAFEQALAELWEKPAP
jgi:predicted DsbA family dithiol-disulfide isomerase